LFDVLIKQLAEAHPLSLRGKGNSVKVDKLLIAFAKPEVVEAVVWGIRRKGDAETDKCVVLNDKCV
jgi:hypothetical protein